LLAVHPKFISTLTASYYGGTLDSGGLQRAEFTATEERVIEIVANGLNTALTNSWRDLMSISLTEQGREVNTQFASVVDGSELVIICSFVVQLPGADSDTIDVVYPLQTLKPIASQLRSRVQSDSSQDNVSWREQLETAILSVPLHITALLGEPSMSVGRMIRLKEGDVVSMNIDSGVKIKVEDNPIFTGEIGEVAGKAAISLQRRL